MKGGTVVGLGLSCLLLAGAAAGCAAPAAPVGDGDGGDGDGDAGDGDGDLGTGDGDSPSSGGMAGDGDAPSGGTTGSSGGSANGAGGGHTAPSSPDGIPLPYGEDFEDGIANGFIDSVSDELTALGSWSVVDDTEGKVYHQSAATDDPSWAVGGDSGWTDQRFETRFKITSGIDEVMLFIANRLSSFDYYYYLELSSDRIKLRVRNDGNADILDYDIDPPIAEGAWHTIALSAVGTALTVELDGVSVITATDSQLTNGGIGLGVRDGAAMFDDISVTTGAAP